MKTIFLAAIVLSSIVCTQGQDANATSGAENAQAGECVGEPDVIVALGFPATLADMANANCSDLEAAFSKEADAKATCDAMTVDGVMTKIRQSIGPGTNCPNVTDPGAERSADYGADGGGAPGAEADDSGDTTETKKKSGASSLTSFGTLVLTAVSVLPIAVGHLLDPTLQRPASILN